MENVLRPLGSVAAVLGLCGVMAACTNPAATKENLLSSSGFKAMPAATPVQVAKLKSLSAHKLSKATYKGEIVWAYADPTICGCVYIGNQDAYNAYVKKAAQAKATDATEARDAKMALDSMQDFGMPD